MNHTQVVKLAKCVQSALSHCLSTDKSREVMCVYHYENRKPHGDMKKPWTIFATDGHRIAVAELDLDLDHMVVLRDEIVRLIDPKATVKSGKHYIVPPKMASKVSEKIENTFTHDVLGTLIPREYSCDTNCVPMVNADFIGEMYNDSCKIRKALANAQTSYPFIGWNSQVAAVLQDQITYTGFRYVSIVMPLRVGSFSSCSVEKF